MSGFNRQKAAQYAVEVQQRTKATRKRQPDIFGKPKTGPPSYAFQNNQRGETDNVAEETKQLRIEEKKIEDDKDEDTVDKNDFKPGNKTGHNPTPLKTTAQTAVQSELKSAFSKCWTIVDSINIPQLYHDEKSWFIPTAIMIFEVLFNMEDVLIGNEELRWVSPHYFSLPVRIYYSVIFYVQCLRAKEQSGLITKRESSWLRAFFRKFKDTACPIAGPLVPIFSNIVACLPDDDQYDYVTPSIPENGTYKVEQDNHTPPRRTLGVDALHQILPSVQLVASLMKVFCSLQQIGNANLEDGSFVPFLLSVGGNFAGITFPPQDATHIDRPISALLSNPVIARGLPEGKTRLQEILPFWRRSRIRNIPDIPIDHAYQPTGPGGITMLEDEFDWFQPCIDMANIQTKFFSDSTNLSSIPTVGGMSSTVLCDLEFTRTTIPRDLESWYPDQYTGSKSKFSATSSELSLDNQYEAAYALTNCEIAWRDANGHKIGGNHAPYRSGPYWDNNKKTFRLETEVPVMTGIYTMIQSHFYDAHKVI